jgi:hypothetical protein
MTRITCAGHFIVSQVARK